MRSYFLVALLLTTSAAANSQSVANPGGVGGPVHWYVTDPSPVPGMRSNIYGNENSISLLNATASSLSSLNFHPSLVFSGSNQLAVNLTSMDFKRASFFTVYQPNDTSVENSIWHIMKDRQTGLVLTTSRMADLSDYQYMNYTDVVPFEPKVNIYIQQKEQDRTEPVEQVWYLGNKPVWPQLPIASFRGLIPEIIAYDRVLTRQERLQVASYLALKYGITLTEPQATYLNSAGEKIWEGLDYSNYHHNIAGIGRDDSSGFKQKKATSSNAPNVLTISTEEELPDNSFLLWGDNGLPLTMSEKLAGFPGSLQKKWLIIPHANNYQFITDVMVDTKRIDAFLPVKPVYWLAIDSSGTGDFALSCTRFIKMNYLDAQGRAHFKGVAWNKNKAGKHVLGFVVAQHLLMATAINYPACNSHNIGSLQVKVIGGKLPIKLTIVNHKGDLVSQSTINEDKPKSVLGINSGKYYLKVIDALSQVCTDSFYVNNIDAPRPIAVAANYMLHAGEKLTINAADQMPEGLSYEWKGPNNFRSFNALVTITQPGTYTLSCTRNGCSNLQEVIVNTYPYNILNKITVFPNPSQGPFSVKIALPKPADVSMTIFDPEGKPIVSKRVKGFANYTFTNELLASGMYKLVFRSGQSAGVRKLVIAR